MLNKDIKVSDLEVLLTGKYGSEWIDWEPETIMLELGEPDYLVLEKVFILKVLHKNLNEAIILPEFLVWMCAICSNEYAEFEILEIPTCLELAWALEEAKKIGKLIRQPLVPSESLSDIVGYLLRLEGFSKAVYPFEFVDPKHFHPGQTEEDSQLKAKGIAAYIQLMNSTPAFKE